MSQCTVPAPLLSPEAGSWALGELILIASSSEIIGKNSLRFRVLPAIRTIIRGFKRFTATSDYLFSDSVPIAIAKLHLLEECRQSHGTCAQHYRAITISSKLSSLEYVSLWRHEEINLRWCPRNQVAADAQPGSLH